MNPTPLHPGEILKREYMSATGLSVTKVAQALRISRKNLSEVINGHTGISPEMALRLAKAFGTTPEYWTELQSHYELWHARQKNVVEEVQVLYRAKNTSDSMNAGDIL